MTPEKRRERADQLRKEIQELEAQVEVLDPSEWDRQFAVQLHDRFCHADHNETCGWYYEISWEGHTHARWLRRATQMMEAAGDRSSDGQKRILRVIDAFRAP
jgi:hypothetical protein